jgi:NNP family nitrate/nitrite transporter-like MFS transporter
MFIVGSSEGGGIREYRRKLGAGNTRGGIGGFYLPVVMGAVKESTGGYQGGFLTFGILAAVASLLVLGLQHQWRAWAIPEQA